MVDSNSFITGFILNVSIYNGTIGGIGTYLVFKRYSGKESKYL